MNGVYALDGTPPDIAPDAWVAPGALIVGRVVLRAGASVWFNAVLRGDNEPIDVGEGSNVQDGCVLHTDMGFPLSIAPGCTIGHLAILHGCAIGAGALIGMGATVLTGARIGAGTLVGAGALITEGKTFPDGVLVTGRPGKVVRDLTRDEIADLRGSAERYQANAARFRSGLTQGSPPAPGS